MKLLFENWRKYLLAETVETVEENIEEQEEELEEYAIAPASFTRMGDKDTPQTKPLKFGEAMD